MTPNLGRTDRIIRFIVGLVLLLAPLANIPPIWSSGMAATLVMIVGAVLMITSVLRFCPLYRLVGLSTCRM